MSAYVGTLSYGLGAFAFLGLSALLLTSWRGRLRGGLLLAAAVISALWAGATAWFAIFASIPFSAVLFTEILRNAVWLSFLLSVLWAARARTDRSDLGLGAYGVAIGVVSIALLAAVLAERSAIDQLVWSGIPRSAILFGFLLMAVAGLTAVEQLYRNTVPANRWAIKFLCLGAGGLFAYDLFLYSNALLFRRLDGTLWNARGLVNAMVVPFLAVSARRNPDWAVDIFISRHIVFHSVAVLGAGFYLMLMAGAGYYIRLYGGSWGGVAQAAFLFGALLLLLALMFSGQVRSKVKVFVGKHFFQYKYDHREQWLRFTRRLSSVAQTDDLRSDIVAAIADVVESPGGVMWLRDDAGGYRALIAWNETDPGPLPVPVDDSMVRFLETSEWIIFLDEYRRIPEHYENLELPDWLESLRRPWLVVPLMHGDALLGFIVLSRSETLRELNWEDSDLLKTVGRQAASYLALLQANDALSEARQFEAFNRLSAYVVHDLKNLVAQLSLVVSNARRHRDSPEFIDDAITTVENATNKMNRLLAQLRKGRLETGGSRSISLGPVLEEVVRARAGTRPAPKLMAADGVLHVTADPDRFSAVIEHLVQNAQEATPADGEVIVKLSREGSSALIEVIDDGCGMAPRFVSERLFKPFDTTKGNAGMGVGVYESREFVRAIGGEIGVDSHENEGTVFRVKIPLDAPVHDELPRASSVEMTG